MSTTTTGDRVVREASDGDERALAKIFRDFHRPLYRYCLAIVGNRQDAEDVLQETMVKALRALPGEQRDIALKPWLYRVAHNESIDLIRRRRVGVSLEVDDLVAGEGLAEQVETRHRLRQLIADLGALPERQRGVLLMREAGGLDFDEIAAALETSPAVARQTLYEARLGLREMETGRDMECAAVTQALSDGDRRVRRRRDIRAHLRDCVDCRSFAEEIDARRNDLAAITPLPAAAAAALLHGALGGGAGLGGATAAGAGAGAGSGAGGLVAGTAAKSVGAATLLKGAAAIAVVAAIGVGAADRGGLVQIGNDHAPTTEEFSAPQDIQSGSGGTTLSGGRDAASARRRRASRRPPPTAIRAARSAPATPDLSEAKGGGPASSASTEAIAPSAPGESGAEHGHGRGHAKQLPAAAAHGQETAASHKPEKRSPGSAAPGKSGESEAPGASQPVHPTHPSHPEHPAKPPEPAEPGSAGKAEGKKPE